MGRLGGGSDGGGIGWWGRSARNLDLHHIVPREHGGTHAVENLITLCEGHHLAHHRGTLEISGTASQLVIKRSPPSRCNTETRVVETTRALRELGFSAHEVKAAIDATRTLRGYGGVTARAQAEDRAVVLPATDWVISSALANRSEHVHHTTWRRLRRGRALRIDATRTHVGTAELPLEHWSEDSAVVLSRPTG